MEWVEVFPGGICSKEKALNGGWAGGRCVVKWHSRWQCFWELMLLLPVGAWEFVF
jgi:hypothetical protein